MRSTNKNKLKILIPNATSPRNIGDQAMLFVLLKLLKKSIPYTDLTIHSTDPYLYRKRKMGTIKHTLYSWSVLNTSQFHIRIVRVIQLLSVLTALRLGIKINIIPIQRQLEKLLEDYKKADLLIFAPGGYLRSQRGITQTLNLLMILSMFFLAKILHKKTIIAPISFGPFAYKWQEKLSAKLINGFSLVAAREKISYKIMSSYRIKNLIYSSDMALLINGKKKDINHKKKFILGFTFRNWFDDTNQVILERKFIDAIKKFSAKSDIIVKPLIQVNAPTYGDYDSQITKNIYSKLLNKGVHMLPYEGSENVFSMMKQYAKLDALLGMRMHSNILAAVSGVPFVALAYEHKTSGITRQLGMSRYCLSVKDLESEKIFKLLIEVKKKNDSLRKHLLSKVNEIKKRELPRWSTIFKSFVSLEGSKFTF